MRLAADERIAAADGRHRSAADALPLLAPAHRAGAGPARAVTASRSCCSARRLISQPTRSMR
jgi:hypothetical protein